MAISKTDKEGAYIIILIQRTNSDSFYHLRRSHYVNVNSRIQTRFQLHNQFSVKDRRDLSRVNEHFFFLFANHSRVLPVVYLLMIFQQILVRAYGDWRVYNMEFILLYIILCLYTQWEHHWIYITTRNWFSIISII